MITNSRHSRKQLILAKSYSGNVVMSDSDVVMAECVQIELLNDLVVKVSFNLDDDHFVFRAVVRNQNEGTLILIQKRVTKNYILIGQSGFLHGNKGVHGGYVYDLEAFYFHLSLQFFDGSHKEVYFLGTDKEEANSNFINQDFKLQA